MSESEDAVEDLSLNIWQNNSESAKNNAKRNAMNDAGLKTSLNGVARPNQTFGLEKLNPVINQLQNVFSTTGTSLVQLPQIIVIGEQSSGKSSVLESICGFSFLPRGTNTCTRCPIVLQMIKANRNDEQYRALSANLKTVEWIEFPQLSEGNIETDFNRVSHIITNEVDRRAAGKNVIVKDELIVRIISPNVINLTLVDLPGFVSAPAEGQPEDMEQQIMDMVTRYASNPNSIILAVSAANNDIQNPKTIKFAKTIDPKGKRTICVLTKLDLMDFGTDATDVLTGQIIKVKLGIVGVVNRSYDDTVKGVSIEDSIACEAKFLIDNYPTIASYNGIPNLKVRLQRLLMKNIVKNLPTLQTRLTKMLIQTRNQLAELGNVNITNKSAVMLEIIEEFCSGLKSSINGKNRHIQKKRLVGSAQINLAFEEDLARSLEKIIPSDDLDDVEILTTISNSRCIESSVLISEAAYQDLVRDQIRRLEEPALKCASTVNLEIINIMNIWTTNMENKIGRFPYLSASITGEVTELLTERHLVVHDLLKNYVDVQASFIKTFQMDFNTEMQNLISKNALLKSELLITTSEKEDEPMQSIVGEDPTEMQKKQCQIVRELVQKYFDIVKSAFQDYCPKAIAHTVVYFMESNIQRRLIEKLHTPDKIDELVRECEAIEEQRKFSNAKIQAMESALEAIRDIKNTKI